MRLLSILLIILCSRLPGISQLSIQLEDKTLLLSEIYTPDQKIVFDATITAADNPEVRLFKQYFNPSSLENYKFFFLPQDWMGATQDNFNQWQARIRKDKLYLEQILYLKDNQQKEYLVFQYLMESQTHSVPASTEFKKVNGHWKHTSLQKDLYGPMLSRIGLVNPEFLQEEMSKRANEISLVKVQDTNGWKYTEKFDRSTTFSAIEQILQTKSIHSTDIQTAKTYFIGGNDIDLIEFISEKYQINHWDLMEAINAKAGFKLYNFTRPENE